MKKNRLFLMDIMRILCALAIYMMHSVTIFRCSYGHLIDGLVSYLTYPVMTCFFMMSGFATHYNHREEEISADWIKSYLKKRFISLFPSYLLAVLVWPLVYPSHFVEWIQLLPVSLFGVQTAYSSLFGITHVGGTWFVSCLLFCYLIYPIVKAVMNHKNGLWRAIVLLLVSHALLMYSNYIIPAFSLETIYSNPIARMAEFVTGLALSEIIKRADQASDNGSGSEKARQSVLLIICVIASLTCISVIMGIINHASIVQLVFYYLGTPAICILLFLSVRVHILVLEKSRIISCLSGITYQFFLMQLFIWELTSSVLRIIKVDGNIVKITVSFILCLSVSFVVKQFYDKPIQLQLKKKLMSRI